MWAARNVRQLTCYEQFDIFKNPLKSTLLNFHAGQHNQDNSKMSKTTFSKLTSKAQHIN